MTAGDPPSNGMQSITIQQQALCNQHGVEWCEAQSELKLGIALATLDGRMPVNGLRHPPEGDTTGWYLWAGEQWSDDPDFFQPLCVAHLEQYCPLALKYLGLPPGWRFLTDGTHEDVWYDAALLEI